VAGDESLVRYRAALEFVGLTDEERAALRGHLEAGGRREDLDVDLGGGRPA
jgi:hypothetical protein